MQRACMHGIHTVDLSVPGLDNEAGEMLFVFRSAWEIVCEMMLDTALMDMWTWQHEPQYNTDGERMYGDFMAGQFVESVYNQIQDDAATVVFIIIGSDATQIRKRLSAHPFYISVGNLPTHVRMKPSAWRVAGFVPELCSEGNAEQFSRRKMLLFNACAHHLLKECGAICIEGGRYAQDGRGIWRKIVPVLAMWNGDRQEHEMVTMSKVHSCFHCDCPADQRDNVEVVEASQLKSQSQVKAAVMEAMTTGQYGANDEWRQKIARARPFMNITEEGYIGVTSLARYSHCTSVLGVRPEFNLLWELPYTDLPQQCRDDPLHMVALGIMPHIMASALSKYIEHLHPPWAVVSKIAPGFAGMMSVCNRIGRRLRSTGVRMSEFVCESFARALAGRESHGHWTLKWGLTGSEFEKLFGLLPFCLQDLVAEEVAMLNNSRPGDEPVVTDPSSDIVLAVGKVLTWFGAAKAQYFTQSEADSLHEIGLQLMQFISEVFPSRNVRIPRFDNSNRDECMPSLSDRESQCEEPTDCDAEDEGSMEDGCDGHDGEDGKPRKGAWNIPKFHAIAHVRKSIELFGRYLCVYFV